MKATPSVAWGAAIGALAAADLYCDSRRNDSTLSACTRVVFRTDTTLGKAAFTAAWLGFSAWVIPHIIKEAPCVACSHSSH